MLVLLFYAEMKLFLSCKIVMCVFFMVPAVDSSDTESTDSATTRGGGDKSVISLSGSETVVDRMKDKTENTMVSVSLRDEVVELEEPNWSCVRCTFLNHPALNVCECCSFERSLEPSERCLYPILLYLCWHSSLKNMTGVRISVG